jgi:cell cycle sensor histidine kinase DivJ
LRGEFGTAAGQGPRTGDGAGRSRREAGGTAAWLESWLAAQVHDSAGSDLTERARHERFIVAHSTAAAVTLAALPALLIWRGVPSVLESLALLALVVPLGAVALLSRCGGLPQAQGVASGALVPFAAALCAAFGGPAGAAALLLLAIPFQAMTAGSKGGFLASAAMAAAALPLALALAQAPPLAAAGEAAAVGAAVAVILAFSHALAALAVDLRLKALVRTALRAGEAREGATLQALDDLITWHDRNGLVLRANAAAGRLLGVPPLVLQGRGLFARVHVGDRPAFVKAISDAAASDETVTVRLRVAAGEEPARGGAGLLWVEMRAHRLRGGSACVVAVSRNISHAMAEREAAGAAFGTTGAARVTTVAPEPCPSANAPSGTRVHRLSRSVVVPRPFSTLQQGMTDVA